MRPIALGHKNWLFAGSLRAGQRAAAVMSLIQSARGEYPSLWACIESIAPKIGCVPQTLNDWVNQQEIDTEVREEFFGNPAAA